MILTPKIAGATVEAEAAAAEEVSYKMIKLLSTGSTATCVNLPVVDVAPPPKSTHRILHLHRSVPGVMSNINSVVAATGANIKGQLLQTDGEHGYAILDVERAPEETSACANDNGDGAARKKAAERSRVIQSLKAQLRTVPHTMYVKSLLRSDGTWGGLSALEDYGVSDQGLTIHAGEVMRGMKTRNLEVPLDRDDADIAEW